MMRFFRKLIINTIFCSYEMLLKCNFFSDLKCMLLLSNKLIYTFGKMQVGTGARAEKIRTYNYKVNFSIFSFSWFYILICYNASSVSWQNLPPLFRPT